MTTEIIRKRSSRKHSKMEAIIRTVDATINYCKLFLSTKDPRICSDVSVMPVYGRDKRLILFKLGAIATSTSPLPTLTDNEHALVLGMVRIGLSGQCVVVKDAFFEGNLFCIIALLT